MTDTEAPIADTEAVPEIVSRRRVYDGFRKFDLYRVRLAGESDEAAPMEREVLGVGRVVAVLPYDPARDAVVLIREFRLPAHLALGRGNLVEIVAGGVEPGEALEQAALRECREEIGAAPRRLIHLLRWLASPGVTDETIDLFLGEIDSTTVPDVAGAPEEGERTYPFVVPRAAALEAVRGGRIANGPLVMALLWLTCEGEAVRQRFAR
jgi:ADP-ribose pyrophosphatase